MRKPVRGKPGILATGLIRVFLAVSLAFLSVPLFSGNTSTPAYAAGSTIYVPDNYPTIQAAVAAASSGDTIIVRSGNYTENINITTANLTIVSQNGSAQTIVRSANPNDHVFDIGADFTTIRGFTITGASALDMAGVFVAMYSDHAVIEQNVINGNYTGVYLSYAATNDIGNNNCSSNNRSGIRLMGSSAEYNNIVGNTFNNNSVNGIWLYAARDNIIVSNTVAMNTVSGVLLEQGSTGNNIIYNEITGNAEHGVFISGFSTNYNNLSVNRISQSNNGIRIEDAKLNSIGGNTIFLNNIGIQTFNAQNNIITANNLTDNFGSGFYPVGPTSTNAGNLIYLNNLSQSTNVFPAAASTNNLYSSVPSLNYKFGGAARRSRMGNYYSDYTGPDSSIDGIGDSPYAATYTNNDIFPLKQTTDRYSPPILYLASAKSLLPGSPNLNVLSPGTPSQAPAAVLLSSGGGSVVFASAPPPPGSGSVASFLPNTTFDLQITVPPDDFNTPMAAGHIIRAEIGYSTDGVNFTPGGPSANVTGDGSARIFGVSATGGFAVPAGARLAVRLTNTSGTAYTVQTGGVWSYLSAPEPVTLPTYILTMQVNPPGSGTTTPPSGNHLLPQGTSVNITALPAAGYRFVNWTGNVTTVANTSNATTNVTINGNYTITANFGPAASGNSTIEFDAAIDALGYGPWMYDAFDATPWVHDINPDRGVYAYAALNWNPTGIGNANTPGSGGSGHASYGVCTAENTTVQNGIANVTMELDDYVLGAIHKKNWGIMGQAGDIRDYVSGTGVIKVNGVTKLKVTNVRMTLDVDWTAPVGPGDAIRGSGWGTIDVANSDAAWVNEFDNGNGQVDFAFTSFSPVIQSYYGFFTSHVVVKGASQAQIIESLPITATGVTNFPLTGVALNVTSFTNGGVPGNLDQNRFTVRKFLASPNGTAPAGITAFVPDYCWEMNTVLDAINTGITLTTPAVATPGNLRILYREFPDRPWSTFSNYTLVDNTHIRANNVTALGQFALGFGQNYTLTMAVSPPGAGLTIPATGNYTYASGTSVNISSIVIPNGYDFVAWTGGVIDPFSRSTSVVMDGNKTVTANFAPAANLTGWAYRKPIAIAGSNFTLTNYQVRVQVNFVSGHMKPDFTDIRFATADGSALLNYWHEYYTANTSAVFWVKVPVIPPAGTTVQMYYGNPEAGNAYNGDATFEFFDDFSLGLLDTVKWSIVQQNPDASFSVSQDRLNLNSGSQGAMSLRSAYTGGDNTRVIFKSVITTGGSGGNPYIMLGHFDWTANTWPALGDFWSGHPDIGTASNFNSGNGGPGYAVSQVATTWAGPHDWTTIQLPSTAQGIVDGTPTANLTTDLYHQPRPVRIIAAQYGSTASTLSVGTVMVTKYVTPEPLATIGQEQGMQLPVRNVNTGERFATIQAAIDAAGTLAGHTINVDPGTYIENVNVTKALTIQSASGNASNTIVRAALATDHVFDVTVNGTVIRGLTVYGTGITSQRAGIYLNQVSGCVIENNFVGTGTSTDNDNGIHLYRSANNQILGNRCIDNDDGIRLEGSDNNTIANNFIQYSHLYGIHLDYSPYPNGSDNNIIRNNTVTDGEAVGIYVYMGISNQITDNQITWHVVNSGLRMWNTQSNTVRGNTISHSWTGIDIGITSNPSNNSTIYLNDFISNNANVVSQASSNIWRSPTPLSYVYQSQGYTGYLGNYYSNYTGLDNGSSGRVAGDGIGDTAIPVTTDGGGDSYPLMAVSGNYVSGAGCVLTLAVNPPEGGTTSPISGNYTYLAGTTVNITATAAYGYRFVSWNGTVANASDPSTNVTVNADMTVVANFALIAPGDGDGDGFLGAGDITKIERIIVWLDPPTPGADANQDGVIDARDITKLERKLAGVDA